MSYDIVKSIKIKEGQVLINAAESNVRPHYYTEESCSSLTKILAEQGKDALELEIFKQFESGTFKGQVQKYQRALQVLRNTPEYETFNWRNGQGTEYDEINKRRDTKAFDDLLKKALKTPLPKDKFIVTKLVYDGNVFLLKVTRRYAKWTREQAEAKVFRFKQEAENIKTYFTNAENWVVKDIT
jgi:hypothetical protein